MKKTVLVLLIISSFVCAMEDESSSCFSKVYSFFSNKLKWLVTSQVLSPMQEVQKSKDSFEVELVTDGAFVVTLVSNGQVIDFSPNAFFQYCYQQNSCFERVLANAFDDTYIAEFKGSLLDKYKKARIDDYSALGAAIISKRESFLDRQNFIKKLLNKGFMFTEKDKTLGLLALYNEIPTLYKKSMILLLHDHQESDLNMFPHEVRKLIVDHMVCLHKSESLCYLLS